MDYSFFSMKYFIIFFLFVSTEWLFAINDTTFFANKKAFFITDAFEENKGQIIGQDASEVLFVYKTEKMDVFILNGGLAYQFKSIDKTTNNSSVLNSYNKDFPTSTFPPSNATYRMDMLLMNANKKANISTYGKSNDYTNFYNFNALNVHRFDKIVFEEIYPNIDWVIYVNENGIKYDFIVKPNGNPELIKFTGKWIEKMYLDEIGNLHLENRLGEIQEQRPVSFQKGSNIETQFVVSNDTLSFNLTDYNQSDSIVIDPQIIWGSYYGGESSDQINAVSTDNQGNVYFCGGTSSFTGIASGGFSNTNPISAGFQAAFLVKFNAAGQRIWATYYGGQSYTGAFSCKVDSDQNIVIAGTTDCSSGISFNGFQNVYGGGVGIFDGDAFIAKFDSLGNRIWATYFGGFDGDSGTGMDIDNANNILLVGFTKSATGISLNGHQNSLQTSLTQDAKDGFLAKFTSSGALIWSTYFGGAEFDEIWSVSCGPSNEVFVAGRTSSINFPTLNAHQSSIGNPTSIITNDAFVAKFSSAGSLIWSTYYGGSSMDEAWGCSTDNLGNVFICGRTESNNAVFFNGFLNGTGGSFLAKFSPNGLRLWGTYLGQGNVGGNAEWGFSCATDALNNVYMVGRTDDPTIGFQGFQNTFQNTNVLSSDGYIAKFSPTGARIWVSYYGGQFVDGLRGCHVDQSNQLYVVGSTNSSNNIFFQGFQSTGQFDDGYIAKIGCPSPQLINLPTQICASSSLQLVPFPSGGNLQLLGQGQLLANQYTAPNVAQNTVVNIQYTINSTSFCPSATSVFSFTILPNITPSISITASEFDICADEQVDFTANIQNAGNAPEIQWFVNNNLVSENQSIFSSTSLVNNDIIQCVVSSDNFCASPITIQSNSITISVQPNPIVTIIYNTINGGLLIVDSGFDTYQWTINGAIITGAVSSTFAPFINGNYSIIVSNEFGCEASDSIILTTLSIDEVNNSAILYPNPNNGIFTIQRSTSEAIRCFIFDCSGQQVTTFETNNSVQEFDFSYLPKGVYFIYYAIDEAENRIKLVVN